MAETIQTWEDKIVACTLDHLPELAEIGDGPRLKILLGADKELIREYGDGFVPFEEFAGTEWGKHVNAIVDWAEALGFRTSIDSEILPEMFDLPEEGRVIVNISPKVKGGPIHMYVFCETSGEIAVEINVTPLDESVTVYDGPIEDLDGELVNLREYAYRNQRPFVSGRVAELTRDAGVNSSQARAIALREIGYTHEEVADHLDISKGASGSFQSKFNRQVEQAEHLLIAHSSTPKRVLAKEDRDETTYERETFYVCEEAEPAEEPRAFFVTVREESGGIDVATETFASLDACINEKYADRQFEDSDLCDDLYRVFRRIDDLRLEEAGHLPLREPRTLIEPNTE